MFVLTLMKSSAVSLQKGGISRCIRDQATLFPERLDDYISEENPVRFIDVFVDDQDKRIET